MLDLNNPWSYVALFLGIIILSILMHIVLRLTRKVHYVRDTYYKILFIVGIFFVVIGPLADSLIILSEGIVILLLSLLEHNIKIRDISNEKDFTEWVHRLIKTERELREREKKLKKQIDDVYRMAKLLERKRN